MTLMKLAEEDVDRHQRAVQSVCRWGEEMSMYITVDDAVNIVDRVIYGWKPANIHEATSDLSRATEKVRTLGGVVV